MSAIWYILCLVVQPAFPERLPFAPRFAQGRSRTLMFDNAQMSHSGLSRLKHLANGAYRLLNAGVTSPQSIVRMHRVSAICCLCLNFMFLGCSGADSEGSGPGSAIEAISPTLAYTQHVVIGSPAGPEAQGLSGPVSDVLGGGDLAGIMGVHESAHGTVLVLDREYKKVVEFDSLGRFVRVVAGGLGEGPGMFLFPRGLAVSPSGDTIAVLDRNRSDVQYFDPAGAYLGGFKVGYSNPFQILWNANGLNLRRYPGASSGAVVIHQPDGAITDSAGLLSGKARELARGGYTGLLGSVDGITVYAHPVPGEFEDVATKRRFGEDLEPTRRGELRSIGGGQPVFVSPLRILGIGQLGRTQRNFLAYAVRNESDSSAVEAVNLVIYDHEWHPIRRTVLDFEAVLSIDGSRDNSTRLYITSSDPYPRVIYIDLSAEMVK